MVSSHKLCQVIVQVLRMLKKSLMTIIGHYMVKYLQPEETSQYKSSPHYTIATLLTLMPRFMCYFMVQTLLCPRPMITW